MSAVPATNLTPQEQVEALLTVWEKTVDLQMHFNDLCMGVRKTAIGALGVLLGAGALSFRFGGNVNIYGRDTSVAFIFIAVALLVWTSFWLMDRFWYHKLLRSSVAYAETLEAASPTALLGFNLDLSRKIREYNRGRLSLSGAFKINFFYGFIAAALVLADFMLFTGAIGAAANG
jgi:hypothetical protein